MDRNPNLVSIVTIIRWMFYGKRAFYIFPKAGIIEKDIANASTFGAIIIGHMNQDSLEPSDLLQEQAVRIEPSLLLLEKERPNFSGCMENSSLQRRLW